MDKTSKIDKFLKELQELSKETRLSPDRIYTILSYYSIPYDEQNISIENYFDRFINNFRNVPNANVFVDTNWSYFCQFTNDPTGSMYDTNPIKIYVPLRKEYLEENVNKIIMFMAKNNIVHRSKLAKKVRADDLVLRVRDKNVESPLIAERISNAEIVIRAARNEAAHASDRTAATQAAILFNEAVEALEAGYAGTALRTSDLSGYYRTAEDYLDRCGARKPLASARAEEEPEPPAKAKKPAKSSANTTNRKSSGSTSRRNGSSSGSGKRTSSGTRSSGGSGHTARKSGGRPTRAEARQRQKRLNRKVVLVLLAMLVIGLLLRGFAMNWQ